MHCQFAIWLEGGLGKQKTEKTSGFQSWKDHGIDLSKLLGKKCIVRHHYSLGLQRSADGLQRPLLIPPAQKSSPHNKYILLRIYRHTSVETMHFLSAV